MATVGQPYTHGNWVVQEGQEDEFIKRWTEFTEWAHQNSPGAESFVLLRNVAEPRQFVSFGSWADGDSVNAWRSTPEFAQRMASCREVCEDFRPADSTLAAAVGA
jgi:heme-degrading monooxygenase HmoA